MTKTVKTKKATKKIAKELEAAGCDICYGKEYYTIDKIKHPCVCTDPQNDSYEEVMRKAVTTLENRVNVLEEANIILRNRVDIIWRHCR